MADNTEFFDGETNPNTESNTATTTDETKTEENQQSSPVDETVMDNADDERFNVRSELFNSGEIIEAENTSENAGDNSAEENVASAENSNVVQQPEQPYRTLKYHGQDIGVKDEEELIRYAQQGLDYTQKMQVLAPYRKLVEKMETDPLLKQQIIDIAINNKQVASIQPQQSEAQQPIETTEPEPAWAADESYDAYRARHDEWKNRQGKTTPTLKSKTEQPQPNVYIPPQTEAEFNTRVANALKTQEEERFKMNIAQKVREDIHGGDVFDYMSTKLPRALQEAVDKDPITFQMVYDQIRQGMFGESYFINTTKSKPLSQQKQQVQIKQSGNKAPFVERSNGQASPVIKNNNSGLPNDIWNMTEKDFDKLVDSIRDRR